MTQVEARAGEPGSVKAFARRIVEAPWFEPFMIGTFVVLNLFIAVVINNLEQSKLEQLDELNKPVTHEDVLHELERTRDALRQLQSKIAGLPQPPSSSR